MTIEPGSEWLHLESLTVVIVTGTTGKDFVSYCPPHELHDFPYGVIQRPIPYFLRDYRPNVPVTPELLEGMGWARHGFAGIATWIPGGGRVLAEFYGNEVADMSIEINEAETIIPFPATLRDLLTLLRVLGVDSASRARTCPEDAGR